jgi:8-oxo-dGTP diphosphatase
LKPRACAAIIRDDKVLMVRHQNGTRNYWTLPGGGVMDGESLEQAAIREVLEETHLDVSIVRLLFEEPDVHGVSYCYLAVINSEAEAILGSDPEEDGLPHERRMLQEVGWRSLEEMKNDRQVSKVIAALGL